MANIYPPSVRGIRGALERVPGALRWEPLTEDAGVGDDPGAPTWISNPERDDQGSDKLMSDQPEYEDVEDVDEGTVDEPEVVFEVPPELTDADVRKALGDERIGELQQLHQVRGIDALGWYVTFHQLRSQHGIHIPVDGPLYLAVTALDGLDLPLARKIELGFHAILRHELFHFEADCMIANWELTTGAEAYWSSRRYRNADGHMELEEALANAYMLRGFKHPTRLLRNAPGAYAALKRYCLAQPAGYASGPLYAVSRTKYLDGCRELSRSYRKAAQTDWVVPRAFDPILPYPSPVKIDWTRCPIMLYDKRDILLNLGIRPEYFSVVTDVEETDKFLREFRKLDRSIQQRWHRSKLNLERSTALTSLDFKPWGKPGSGRYSVRVGGNFRAHLRLDRGRSRWFAEAIGDHKEMGHG